MFLVNFVTVIGMFIIILGALIPDRVVTTFTPESQKAFYRWYLIGVVICSGYIAYMTYKYLNPKTYVFTTPVVDALFQ